MRTLGCESSVFTDEICPPRGRPHLGAPCRRGPCDKTLKIKTTAHFFVGCCRKRRTPALMKVGLSTGGGPSFTVAVFDRKF